jgi:hypothetical protein
MSKQYLFILKSQENIKNTFLSNLSKKVFFE